MCQLTHSHFSKLYRWLHNYLLSNIQHCHHTNYREAIEI